MGDRRQQLRWLVDRISDREVEIMWGLLEELYCDRAMLAAIEAAGKGIQPGDVLDREAAIEFLYRTRREH